MMECTNIFAMHGMDLGKMPLMKHSIKLMDYMQFK